MACFRICVFLAVFIYSFALGEDVQTPPRTEIVITNSSTTTDPDPASDTTTTATTTTTVAPTPSPNPGPPETGIWSYTNLVNQTCVIVQFAGQLKITYTTLNNSTLANATVNVPANATVTSGYCGNDTQNLILSWGENNMTLEFVMNVTTHQYTLRTLNITIQPDDVHFPNAGLNKTIKLQHSTDEWATPVSTSYRCTGKSQLQLSQEEEQGSGSVATLDLWHLQEEAFRSASGKGFSTARDCGGGDVPDAVPIAVGCALGGLVLVVLVAYLVGRRRSAARGYLSM